MQVQPYLFFDGRCEEAAEFYKRNLGAEIIAMIRFKDSPEPPVGMAPGSENKVMHMALKIGDTQIMASDGANTGATNFHGFSLALSVKTPAEAERLFSALADGGQVRQPLVTTFFSPKFGMVADKFGLGWMVMAEAAQSGAGQSQTRKSA
jgi:PhnB protein